jgi:hypothetical protein
VKIKTLDPKKASPSEKGFDNQTNFHSFIKHDDLLIFGFGCNENGIAIYDKDYKLIDVF